MGIDHDTAHFAVNSIRSWWQKMGRSVYGGASQLLITADAGGSNGPKTRLWKAELQKFANRTGLSITVCHYPPGTSKWNKIEHRLFCHIAMNWRSKAVTSLAAIVSLIGSTTTTTGLRVRSEIDKRSYPKGVAVGDEQMAQVNLKRHDFHGTGTTPFIPSGLEEIDRLFLAGPLGLVTNNNQSRGSPRMETSQTLSFANISGKMIEADFDGGTTTSDGGALLLRQAEARTGIVDRIVAAMSDRRHQSYIDHTYTDLIRQRVFQIACGYEDANDSDDLRCDPGLKTACDRLPLTGDDLASQPTMSRLENSVSRSDLYRIGLALLEAFIESYDQPPKKLTIDIDDTDDPAHGAQQLTLFHAYYDEYCYLPVHLYEGESGKLITTLLRPRS